MRLTTAEAALAGASLAALATYGNAWITQFATSRRERERRVWDRRAEVYDDVMTMVHRFARLRSAAADTGRLPDGRGHANEAEDSAPALAARLEIYGSPGVVAAHEESFAALKEWMAAWQVWKNQEEPFPTKKDPSWLAFLGCVERSRAADSELLKLMRSEIHGARQRNRLPRFGSRD